MDYDAKITKRNIFLSLSLENQELYRTKNEWSLRILELWQLEEGYTSQSLKLPNVFICVVLLLAVEYNM